MRRIYTILAMLLLSAVAGRAQVNIPNPPVQGNITAATTNASCAPIVQGNGAVDQQVNSSMNSVGISITGTWTATLNIQLSVDHGKTWTASGGTISANQQSVLSTGGYSDVCVFASAYVSGTAVVQFATSSASLPSQVQVQGAAATGSAPVGNPVLVGGKDGSGNVQPAGVISGFGGSTLNTTPVVEQGGGNFSDGQTNATAVFCANTSGNATSCEQPVAPFFFNGTTWDRGIVCENTSTFSVASTTTQVIAASGSTKIRICSFDINPSTITAGSTDIVYGTGANCGTGTTTLTGAYTLPAAAVVDITPATLSATSPLTTPASQAVCVRSVTSTVNGFIVWEQH